MSQALKIFKTAVNLSVSSPKADLLKELEAMVAWLKNSQNQEQMDHGDVVQALQGVRLAQRYLQRKK